MEEPYKIERRRLRKLVSEATQAKNRHRESLFIAEKTTTA